MRNATGSASSIAVLIMRRLFHARLYGIFTEIQSNLRKSKLDRTNQGFNFIGDSFSNRDNVTSVSVPISGSKVTIHLM